MKIPALAAGSLLAGLMVFSMLDPSAKHEAVRAVRNTVRGWEAPLPPLIRAGINVTLHEMGIPLVARHCAAPSSPADAAAVPVTLRIGGPFAIRGCSKPGGRAAFKSGVWAEVPEAGGLRQGI